MTCEHGFIGPCGECDGSGQVPEYEASFTPALTPADVLPDMMSLLSGIASDTGTLRDRFAMAAIQGFLSCSCTAPGVSARIMSDSQALAVAAYVYADAMLKARVQAVPPGPGGEGVKE